MRSHDFILLGPVGTWDVLFSWKGSDASDLLQLQSMFQAFVHITTANDPWSMLILGKISVNEMRALEDANIYGAVIQTI